MPKKSLLIHGATLALLAAHTIRTRNQRLEAAGIYLAAHEAHEEIQAANEAQIQYLCHVLEKNEVPVSEFDLIVLNFNN